MLRSVGLAALGTGFLFLMTSLGAATVFLLPETTVGRYRRALLGFAAGVMTAASVWSLLLPAIGLAAEQGMPVWLPPAAGLLLGAAFLSLLDAAAPLLRRNAEGAEAMRRRQDALLVTAITLHNIPEGMAVGLAFARAASGSGLAAAAALALGIGIQNFPEGAAVALPRLEEGAGRRRAFRSGVLSGAVEPAAGVLAALAVVAVGRLMPWLLSFAAGAMLYVVVEELVPWAHSRTGTCGYLGGFLLMMVLDVALG
jgi:ZIP family zinc transporter